MLILKYQHTPKRIQMSSPELRENSMSFDHQCILSMPLLF
jgi:hypothetical protein